MELAVYLMFATVFVFAVGAAFALVWSLSTNQWNDLESAARIVLDDEED